MKKTTRKLISLLLLSVLLLSIALPAFAAPPEDEIAPQAACSHGSTTAPTYTAVGGYVYYDSIGHKAKYREVKKCKLCGVTLSNYVGYGARSPHTPILVNAKCDGTTQTWFYNCKECNGFIRTETRRCYGATHGGSCSWLPL